MNKWYKCSDFRPSRNVSSIWIWDGISVTWIYLGINSQIVGSVRDYTHWMVKEAIPFPPNYEHQGIYSIVN